MSSSYQGSKTHVKFKAAKGKASDRVISTGKGNFVPTKADCSKPGESHGGKPGKGFSAKGTG